MAVTFEEDWEERELHCVQLPSLGAALVDGVDAKDAVRLILESDMDTFSSVLLAWELATGPFHPLHTIERFSENMVAATVPAEQVLTKIVMQGQVGSSS